MEGEVTQLLHRVRSGDKEAESKLITAVYGELKRLARSQLQGTGNQTLQPTVLVHEAYIKLTGAEVLDIQDRQHFFRLASMMMRQVIVDYARERLAAKRGGGLDKVPLVETLVGVAAEPAELVALNDALERLREEDERAYRVVELRFFGGFSVEETAEVLKVSERTVKREWRFGRAWLLGELKSQEDTSAGRMGTG